MYENIPEAELEVFRPFLRVFRQGETIVVEGMQDDLGLLLLRQGEVDVYKSVGEGRDLIAHFEAINFFGEMALIISRERTATVEAASERVIVYSFRTPDLQSLLSNPRWGTMLIVRLCSDLKRTTEELADLRQKDLILETRFKEMRTQFDAITRLLAETNREVESTPPSLSYPQRLRRT